MKTAGTTNGQHKPEKRIVFGEKDEQYVVTLYNDTVTIRPKRSRSGEFSISWGGLYRHLAWQAGKSKQRKRTKTVSRNLIQTEDERGV